MKQYIIIGVLFLIGVISGYLLKQPKIIVQKEDTYKLDSVSVEIQKRDTIIKVMAEERERLLYILDVKEKNILKLLEKRKDEVDRVDNYNDDELEEFFTERYDSLP